MGNLHGSCPHGFACTCAGVGVSAVEWASGQYKDMVTALILVICSAVGTFILLVILVGYSGKRRRCCHLSLTDTRSAVRYPVMFCVLSPRIQPP